MKISYIDDALTGGGHGFLEFSEADFPASPLSVAIMRASDHQYAAGKAGWTGEKIFLPLSEEPGADGVLQARLGPELVNLLNGQETYGITLKGADGGETAGRLRIKDITYSPDAMLGNTARAAADKEAPGKGGAPAHPSASPAPQASEEVVEKSAPEEPDSSAPLAGDAPLEMARPVKRGVKIWRWVLLLLLLAGCIAWYALDPRKNVAPENPAPAQEAAQGEGEAAREESGATASGPKIRFQNRDVTPAEAAKLSRELPRTTAGEKDAVYRLYYFAAAHGEKGILQDYGACLDPSLPAWGSIEKDAPLAWSIYEDAKKSGDENAAAAQRHLLDWLRQKAPQDRQAAHWLEEIAK